MPIRLSKIIVPKDDRIRLNVEIRRDTMRRLRVVAAQNAHTIASAVDLLLEHAIARYLKNEFDLEDALMRTEQEGEVDA